MARGISDFRAITKAAFARPNLFEVEIHRPSLTFNSTENERLRVNCSSVNIPSKSVGVSEPQQGYRAFAESGLFENEINLSFNMSADFMELRFFQDWLDYIDKPGSKHIEHYNSYALPAKVIITNYDRNQQKSLTTTLHEAYPKTIAELALETGPASEIMKLDITMTYRWYDQKWYKEQRTEPNVIPEPVKVYATKTVDTVQNQINPMLEISKEQWKFQGGGHDDTDVGE